MSEPTWRQAWTDGNVSVDDLFDAIDARNAEIASLGARLEAVADWPTVTQDHDGVHVQWREGQTSARIDRALLDGLVEHLNRLRAQVEAGRGLAGCLRALLVQALDGWEHTATHHSDGYRDRERIRKAAGL